MAAATSLPEKRMKKLADYTQYLNDWSGAESDEDESSFNAEWTASIVDWYVNKLFLRVLKG